MKSRNGPDLQALIAQLGDTDTTAYELTFAVPAAVEEEARISVAGFLSQWAEKLGVTWRHELRPTIDVFHLEGPARMLRAILTDVDGVLSSEATATMTMSAGVLNRRSTRSSLEFQAALAGLRCSVREFRGTLESAYIIEITGPAVDVVCFQQAVGDWMAEYNGQPTLAQRRQRQLDAAAKAAQPPAEAPQPRRHGLRRLFGRHQPAPTIATPATTLE